MKLYHMTLVFTICAMSSSVAMEIAQQSPWYGVPKDLIIQFAAIVEQPDRQSLCSVNKQLSVIASEKNLYNLLKHSCKLNENYFRNRMLAYAVAKNTKKFCYTFNNAFSSHSKEVSSVLCYFIPKDDLLLWQSDIKNYYRVLLPKVMAIYRGEPAAYSAYEEKFKAEVHDNNTLSLLQIAVHLQHLFVVQLLLGQEKRGIVDLRATAGLPSLHTAVMFYCGATSNPEMAALCTQKNIDDSATIVEELCKHPKTNINESDEHGYTALMKAVELDNPTMVKLLLCYKASPKQTNVRGSNACDMAKSKEIKLLLEGAVNRIFHEGLNNGWESLKSSVASWF